MKRLLTCPHCPKTILGEIADDGNVVVKRFPGAYTVIESKEVKIKCGTCGEIVFFKE